jgi:enoyl-CoA hydratase
VSKVSLTIEDGLATIELASPDTRNAIDVAMANELVAVCDSVDSNATVGGVVLHGGSAFCSGGDRADLRAASAAPLDDASFDRISALYDAFVRFGALQVPTVAAIRGAAVGAGLNLVLAADVRVVADDAKLVPGFMRIGLHPGGGHMHLIHRAAGPDAAAAMGMLGAPISGSDAYRIGMAWSVHPDDQVLDCARALLSAVAADPALARKAKQSYLAETRSAAMDWATGLSIERVPQLWSFARLARQPR